MYGLVSDGNTVNMSNGKYADNTAVTMRMRGLYL